MARNTDISLRNKTFCQMFIRQASKTHDFKGFIPKLDMLKKLKVDYVQLLPINPIGKVKRKGSEGSPYSISDYYATNPDYGTMEDFEDLIDAAHNRGIKVIIDIVFNHTSHDSVYAKTHPEWFYQKADGSFCNRVGDWSDIIDLKFDNNPELEEELINVLKHWALIGVDGFRCDVAPLIPLDFWKKAREELNKINPYLVYISESVHLSFIKYLRDLGYEVSSDSEIYQVFDICYDYDIYDDFINYFKKGEPISKWVEGLIRQDSTYPKNYVKLRFLENHDQERIAKYIKNDSQLRNVNSLLFFLKGAPLIYNGQLGGTKHRPDLFEIDEVDCSSFNKAGLADSFRELSILKKETSFVNDTMNIRTLSPHVLEFTYESKDRIVVGIFNISSKEQNVNVEYEGLDYLRHVTISKGVQNVVEPIILVIKK